MGISASSLLDETKSNYVKDQAEAVLKDFSPFFRRQFSVARFSQLEDDLEQNKEKITQLLKQKDAPEEAEVLYEEGVLYFDESRKWRERYVVVRANYCLECHDSLETFVKGVPPRQKLLPTGGAVLTSEEKYMAMVDKCFPDDTVVKEDFAPPLSGMPGQFPVYLRLPYRRDSYFCSKQQDKQDAFLAVLSDCIRHQNQDFLKKKTCEVQAFLKAVQLYRQSRGKYEAWNMLIGSDVRVMGNLVMEQLLPSLEKDMLPRLKAKKTERKRVWFATVEAAYILVQEHLLEGLSALKEDCRITARQREVLIHSDMDQIVGSRRRLEDQVRAKVSERAEKLCSESVQPYLGSVLEELMEPVSAGFQEGRRLGETLMDEVCRDALRGDNKRVKKVLAGMARPSLLSCYQKMSSLQEKVQHLQDRFGFSDISGVIHGAQIDLQQLMENAAYTFEQLFYKAVQDNPDNASSAVEKAKHRVLKQYDYDSSTVRKRISREALVSITLPFIKKNLDPTCRTELQSLEQSVDADYSDFIDVENVYESVLLQTLDKEVTKVVKEAESLRKYNLFTDSRDLVSQSSRSSLSSPSVSTPSSPAMPLASPKSPLEPQPASPLAGDGLSSSPQQEQVNGVTVGQEEAAPTVAVSPEARKAQDPIPVEPPAPADTAHQSETQEVEAAPETVIQEEVLPVKSEPAPEPDPPKEAETLPDQEAAPMDDPALVPDPTTEPVNTSAEGTDSQTVTSSEESSGVKLEAPSSVQTPVLTPVDLKQEEAAEPVPVPDPDSLDVSAGSQLAPSDVEIPEEVQATQSSGEEVSKDEVNLGQSPVSSEDVAEESTASAEPSVEAAQAPTSEPTKEETPSDSVKEIRDLVVEVDELLQRYPSGVPKEE